MLGDKIKMLRISQGLNQTAFAKRLFVTPGAVSQWETGRSTPDTERLIAIAKEFSIPLDFFLNEEKDYTEKELVTEQILTKLNKLPKTAEAKIVSGGMDTLSKEHRQIIVNLVSAMYPGHFEKGTEDDDTQL